MAPNPTHEELEKRISDLEKEVDDRRRAQADMALKESEALKAAMLNGITTNLAFVNENLEIIWANKAAADSVGRTPSELVGRKCHALWADLDEPCENCPTVKAFKSKKTENAIVRTPDGRVWDEKGEPVFDENGDFLGVLEIAHDITELHKAETTLRKAEQKYRELFDSITDLIYSQDMEGRFLSVNQALETLVGYEKAEIIGRKASDLMEPHMRPLFESDYLETLKKKGSHEGTSVYIGKDGRRLYLEYKSKLAQPENGEAYISGVARDVTARIEAKKEKKQLREGLVQSQKMEAIGTLAGGIAHDYNNLLSIVMGNLSLAMAGIPSDSEQAALLEEISNAAKKLRDLTRELMALSRGGEPVRQLGSVKDLIGVALNTLSSESAISSEIHSADDLWPVRYDAGKMVTVLRNILINATEAMPEGGKVAITAENQSLKGKAAAAGTRSLKRGDYVHIAIQDEGRGILAEHLDKIFDPYFSTKSVGVQKGMGLGLATAYAVVQKHDGHITVQSSPGKGTTVHIYLPAERDTSRTEKRILKA